MRVEYVPVLAIHRELQAMPRGMARFRQYLRTILNDRGDDAELPPLVAINPMGREHVTERLDDLLALDADGLAARTFAEAAAAYPDLPGEFRASTVVLDDKGGGWTNRAAVDRALMHPDPGARRFWLVAALWSSEPVTARAVVEAAATCLHRTAYVLRHGPPPMLRDLLAQEGYARAAAGCDGPTLDPDDLDYTRQAIAPHLDDSGMTIEIECLLGDEAARSLGMTPRGLSPCAGLALALHDARMAAARTGV